MMDARMDGVSAERMPDVVSVFREEFESDTENCSKAMIHYYMHATDERQKGFNNALIYLCGWGMDSLIEIAKERRCYLGGTKEIAD